MKELIVLLMLIQPGDVALWMPSDTLFVDFWCPQIEFYEHVDVIGLDGELITSAPPEGCGSTSSFEDRIESGDWKRLKILRNPNLDIDLFLERTYDTECEYDWLGYYLQWSDVFLSCSEIIWFRNLRLLFPLDNYHCVSFMAYCENLDDPHFVVPWKIEGWEVIGEFDLNEEMGMD